MLNEARLYEILEEVLVKVAELVLGKDVAEVVLVVDDVYANFLAQVLAEVCVFVLDTCLQALEHL